MKFSCCLVGVTGKIHRCDSGQAWAATEPVVQAAGQQVATWRWGSGHVYPYGHLLHVSNDILTHVQEMRWRSVMNLSEVLVMRAGQADVAADEVAADSPEEAED